ncbi:Heptaprenyl diphosphate synthase component 2 [Austwickia sp. TVS 96-490-7B]|uniref:polyprenyl synthetase family protein n=1 Tax=Austwickia sp. TVS 96-490-7B TaxID=2830843 RepID=UPI001C5848A7|nr:polyprenyl synthetase family protein [Austwickia sp. TVS 96-490-7B]MBW3085678.1 Heptaprenyl diphosphate synthase component 2 [Austwickia sp. TVS 96-490-7B]
MTAAIVHNLPSVEPGLAASLSAGLARVEGFLAECVDLADPFLAQASGHLLRAGGKRFRPVLTLLAAEVSQGVTEEVVRAAAAVELTHLASLYHDDVMDEAAVRRHVVSANEAYGNSTAILVGDLLFGTASSIVADLGPEAVKIQAETFVRLCAGQIRDARPCPAGQDPLGYYLQVLADKTGVLIATAARYGAMFSGGDADTVDVMRQYGERLGVAFQLADDLLDIASEGAESGKVPGTDLREGVDTLPVLRVRQLADPADAELIALLDSDLGQDEEGVARALELLRRHPALSWAREQTRAVADEARSLLVSLPQGPAVQALDALAAGVVDRSI